MGTLLTVLIFYGGQIRLKIIDMTTLSNITENDKGEQIKNKIDLSINSKYIRFLKYRINSTLRGQEDGTFATESYPMERGVGSF